VKGVVLVGGEGTRLRPLTETIPKSLLPIVNRPFLHRVLDHLAANGVHEVIASSSYLESSFATFIEERHGDPAITWITEREPLGTGGAIVNALPHVDDTFFVLNGDILTDLDLTALHEFHRGTGAVATIALHHVDDARPFGLVAAEPSGRVLEFREKPGELVAGDINAGTYVLEPEALQGWEPGRTTSIEREIFPSLIGRGAPVQGYRTSAYWMDLGTPEKYLQAHFDVLEGKVSGLVVPAPFTAGTANVDLRARLGRWVVVGEHCVVESGSELEDSVLLDAATVGTEARVVESIVGPGAAVGAGATVVGSVLGEGARVDPGTAVKGARVPVARTAREGRTSDDVAAEPR
jgi:mannose-1-phosphate guanylyltransferase